MITGRTRFNIYLLLSLSLLLTGGCKTGKKDEKEKKLSMVRLHLEVIPDMLDFSQEISVLRENPVKIYVDRNAILTEADVDEASVVDDIGGYALKLRFNKHGTWLLEQSTTANPGKHLAIFSQFGTSREESRWLGAPRITRRVSDGVLVFTPDASRAECDRIVLGLNNAAAKVREKSKW